METKALKPQLRFSGFTDAWEKRQLGEVVERVARKNTDLLSTLPLTISAQYGLVDQETFFNKQIASKDVSGYYLIKNGEFAYNKSYSKDYPWGAIKRLDRYEMGVLSTLYILFKPISIISDFLAVYYETTGWYSEVSKIAAEGARNHGLLNIAPSEFFETSLCVPVTFPEQTAIGTFFSKLDRAIALQERKCQTMKNLKKTLLKKMFPENDANTPALRFAGFTDAWEKRQLGEVLEERNEQIPENDDYPLMSFVQNLGVVPKGDRYDRSFLVKDTDKKYKKTKLGDFIYSSNNLETGSIGFNRTGNAVISPVYSIFSSKNNRESEFIGILSSQRLFINKMIQFRQGVVYGQWRIHESDFLSIIVNIPDTTEQDKIITFFSQLDRAIALQEKKLENMKTTKKTLLKLMFI